VTHFHQACQNIQSAFATATRSSLADMRAGKYTKYAIALVVLWLWGVVVGMLYDAEYAGQDVTIHGVHIFSWVDRVMGRANKAAGDGAVVLNEELFPRGIDSIKAQIVQQDVYDCRFLAALASLAATDRGRQRIFNMFTNNGDGTVTVTFARGIRVTVQPLTHLESRLYARTRMTGQSSGGTWLPLLEKAYGQYRSLQQNPLERLFRLLKHGIFDWRWTPEPELPGFGASYGAKDNLAIELLTGGKVSVLPTISWEIGDFGLGKGWVTSRQIMSWFNRERVMQTYLAEQDALLVRTFVQGAIVTATTDVQPQADARGLWSHHAYAVIGYDGKTREIKLQDPMGTDDFVDPCTGKIRDGINDGIFELSLWEFNKYFSHLEVGEHGAVHTAVQ
jgi:hypothetical protein